MHKRVHCCDEVASHQLHIAVAFWIIWIVCTEECSSLMRNLMQVHCSMHSVILNVMTTQYTWSLKGVYHPHWLGRWSHHYSRIQHMYSSPLSLAARLHQGHANCSHYINNSWTFPRQNIYVCICMYTHIIYLHISIKEKHYLCLADNITQNNRMVTVI